MCTKFQVSIVQVWAKCLISSQTIKYRNKSKLKKIPENFEEKKSDLKRVSKNKNRHPSTQIVQKTQNFEFFQMPLEAKKIKILKNKFLFELASKNAYETCDTSSQKNFFKKLKILSFFKKGGLRWYKKRPFFVVIQQFLYNAAKLFRCNRTVDCGITTVDFRFLLKTSLHYDEEA